MGEQLLKFWRWLQNAAQQAAIAEAPAVLTAAGQKINRNTGKVEYNHTNDKGVKQLRSNLAAIGEAATTAPGAAEAIELGYNVVRHPKQAYRAVKRAASSIKRKRILPKDGHNDVSLENWQKSPSQLPPEKVIDISDLYQPTPDELADQFVKNNPNVIFADAVANDMYGLTKSSLYPSYNKVADFNVARQEKEWSKIFDERIKKTLPLAKERGTLRTEQKPRVFTDKDRPYMYSVWMNDTPIIRDFRAGDPNSEYGKLMHKYWFKTEEPRDVFDSYPNSFADRVNNNIVAMPKYGRKNMYKYVIPHEKTHIYINGRKEKELFGSDTGLEVLQHRPGEDVFATIDRDMYLMNPDEQLGRGSQIKNYLGITDASSITPQQLQYAAKNYVKDTGMDNNMTDFFNMIVDYNKAAKWLSLAPAGAPFFINNSIDR